MFFLSNANLVEREGDKKNRLCFLQAYAIRGCICDADDEDLRGSNRAVALMQGETSTVVSMSSTEIQSSHSVAWSVAVI